MPHEIFIFQGVLELSYLKRFDDLFDIPEALPRLGFLGQVMADLF